MAAEQGNDPSAMRAPCAMCRLFRAGFIATLAAMALLWYFVG